MILSVADKTTEDIFNGVDAKAARKIDPHVWDRAAALPEDVEIVDYH